MNVRSTLSKFLWRFAFLFLFFYTVPYDLGFGFSYEPESWGIWNPAISWLGDVLFDWKFDIGYSSIGFDSRFEFTRYLFCLLVAAILSGIWLLVDSYKKWNYEKQLISVIQTVLRYSIAITMLHYGLSKVFLLQFGSMTIDTMDQTIGDQSPMGFMWNFLSLSPVVVMFAGWMEAVGAFLLFFRKTTYLGCILLIVVLSNVVIFNIGYDVSVTFYAIQLLALTLVLVSKQLKGLFNYVVLERQVVADTYRYMFAGSRYKTYAKIVKGAILVLFTGLFINDLTSQIALYRTNETRWFTSKQTVTRFQINSDTLDLTKADQPKLWKSFTFNDISYYPETFLVKLGNESSKRYTFKVDSLKQEISYRPHQTEEGEENDPWQTLKYTKDDKNTYTFEGIVAGDTLRIKTTAKVPSDYNLIKYKGRWIVDLE